MKKILILSAHPDDEILGAGGTLLRHMKNGDDLHWIIATDIFEDQGYSKSIVERRKKEINLVSKRLKMKSYQLGYKTTNLSSETLISLVPKISKIIKSVKPELIYVVNRSDAHSDHRILFQALMASTKSFRTPFLREILMYECISETEFAAPLAENAFIPNCYIDISSEINEKLQLIKIYESEIDNHPFPRSEKNIKALATFRGASCGVEYAEAFQIIKLYRFEKL